MLTRLILFTLFFSSLTNAQNSSTKQFTFKGEVLDAESKSPLEYATITIINSKTKVVESGSITSDGGIFEVNVNQGTYNIQISYMGFIEQNYASQFIDNDFDLGKIYMSPDYNSLETIELIAEKTTVEIKLDKKIYNVGKDITISGGSVSDVLDNIPSVSVDLDGNVALRGNANVRILVNGKPSGLVGLNSNDALRQLPADAIEKVEIITSPSARYNASGTAGILNIILRRSKLQGLNGAVIARGGFPHRLGTSGNINYRTGAINLFNTTSFNKRQNYGSAYNNSEYYNNTFDSSGNLTSDAPNSFINESREFDRLRNGINVNTGVEWYIDDYTSITTSFFVNDSQTDDTTTTNIEELDAFSNLINQTVRYVPMIEDDKSKQFSFNFDRQYNGNSDHRLTFDFQIEDSKEIQNSIIYEEDIPEERLYIKEHQKRGLIQSDFTLPIKKNSRFEIGFNGSFNETNTDYQLEFASDSGFVLDNDLSNILNYKEYNNALYSQFGSKINSVFSFLIGVRMEAINLTVQQLNSNETNKRSYASLFPTLNLSYELSDSQSLSLGYNRRINRPWSRFLNPFPSRSSASNLFQGDPNLNPSFANAIDIGYLNEIGIYTISASIYASRSTDNVTLISEDTGETVSIGDAEVPIIKRGPINLSTNDRLGLEMTVNLNPSEDWRMNTNLNLFQSNTTGSYNGIDYGARNFTWFMRFSNKIKLPAEIQWQTNLFYRGATRDAQNTRKGMINTSMGFSKDLLNEKASIAINISDLFNNQMFRLSSKTQTFESNSAYRRRKRFINIAFTYRFNQKKPESNNGDDFGGFGS